MDLISAESINRPEIVRWHKRMIERYTPPKEVCLSVLLPCSAKKPYSKSKSHMKYQKHIRRGSKGRYGQVHELIMTSPLGLVPRELEEVYPAAHYDVPVTGHWSIEEKELVLMLIDNYKTKVKGPILAFGKGAYADICREAGIECTSDLMGLEGSVNRGIQKNKPTKEIMKGLKRARAVCDYQFGNEAHKTLLGTGSFVKGLQVKNKDGRLLATLDRETGLLALSLLGGEELYRYGRYIVELSFRPITESVFCIGIEKADHQIRPRDEIIATYNGEVVGVGRSILKGQGLEVAEKGLGLILRHKRRE